MIFQFPIYNLFINLLILLFILYLCSVKKLFLFFVILVALVSCQKQASIHVSGAQGDGGTSEGTGVLKVAVMPTLDCMPLYVAKQRGWLDSLGIDVQLVIFNAQMDIDTALVGGSVSGAFTDVVRAERLQKNGLPLRIKARTAASWQLIGNRMSRLKEPKQLGDKMVAMTRFSATDMLTDKVLEGVKTNATVYRVQINDVLLRLQMLRNNEMDALWLPEPHSTAARQMGHTVMWDSKEHDQQLGVLVFREQQFADKRIAKQISSFMEAYDVACDSLNKLGLSAYTDLIADYCKCDESVVKSLPKTMFIKSSATQE